jgi:hypothetical protein
VTKVAFKVSIDQQTKERTVFAFFPMEKDRHEGEYHTAYSHAGKHSLCAKSFFDRRQWAHFAEYLNLYLELVRIGYTDLKVLNKDWNAMKGFAVANEFGYGVNSIEAKIS